MPSAYNYIYHCAIDIYFLPAPPRRSIGFSEECLGLHYGKYPHNQATPRPVLIATLSQDTYMMLTWVTGCPANLNNFSPDNITSPSGEPAGSLSTVEITSAPGARMAPLQIVARGSLA